MDSASKGGQKRENHLVWKIIDGTINLGGVVLLSSEVLVLFSGIIARSVFDHPLIWSVQYARLAFVWLTMLGAVIAIRDNQHMRMTSLTRMLPETWQSYVGVTASLIQVLTSLALIRPSIQLLHIQSLSTLTQLGISTGWESAGIVAGFILMAAYSLRDLLHNPWPYILRSGVVTSAVIGLAFAAAFALVQYTLPELLFIFVLILFSAVAIGVPIAFAFGFCTVFYLLVTGSAPIAVVSSQIEQGTSSIILLAVPLFVLLGGLLTITKLAPAMMKFLSEALATVKGGLYYVLVGGILLVSGISGAKTADIAAVAPIVVPEMKRKGFDEGHILSVTASCGAMAETVPPSIVLIIIGAVTSTSISALFEAGLIPAIILAVIIALLARFWAKNDNTNENIKRPRIGRIVRSFLYGLPALVLPFVIRIFVIDGIATATEIATVGAVYATVLGIVFYGGFKASDFYNALYKTVGLSGAITFIIAVATAMSWALTQSGFAEDITRLMLALPGGPIGFMVGSIVLMIVLGSFLEGIPILVLFGPILFPIARELGISDVQYGIVVVLAMGIGLFAPPVGLGYYAASIITEIDPNKAIVKIWGYLLALTVGLLGIALFSVL